MAEQFEKDQVVSGVSFFDGQIDGKQLNSGVLFILQELDTKNKNAKGQRTVEKKCDSDQVVKGIMHLEFPIKCHIVYEERVSKTAEKLVVISCRPLERARVEDPARKAA